MQTSEVKYYFRGGSFPISGSYAIVSMVNEVLEAYGAQIINNATISEIRIEKDKVLGVRMQDGKDIDSDQVVGSIGIFNTYDQLIPDTLRAKHKFETQLQKIQTSVGHGCFT